MIEVPVIGGKAPMTSIWKVILNMKKTDHPSPRVRGFRGLAVIALVLLSLGMLSTISVYNVGALDPHVLSGNVYEENGTVCASCNVTVTNARTGESATTTSNATGVYAYNLLNLPSGWAYGDTIQVVGENSTGSTGENSTQIAVGTTTTAMDIWIGTTTSVSGVTFYIIDEHTYPVENALINIKDASGDTVTTKISDADGLASATLSDGKYTVTVAKTGYEDKVVTIRVHGTATYTIQIGEAEEAAVTLASIWDWVLIILAIVGVMVIVGYVLKKR